MLANGSWRKMASCLMTLWRCTPVGNRHPHLTFIGAEATGFAVELVNDGRLKEGVYAQV